MKIQLLLLSLVVIQLSSASAEVLRLNDLTFDAKTAGKTVFIKFFAPWCGHCKKMAPDFEKLAKDWEGHEIGLVAEVDCTSEDSVETCEAHEVQGYPTIHYGDPNSPEEYEEGRDYESMAAFCKEHLSKPICSVKNLKHCDKEMTKLIKSLQAKTTEELTKLEQDAEDQLGAAEEEYDEGMEEINKRYRELVDTYNEKVDDIRTKTNYKWISQVISDRGEDSDNSDKAGDEL